MDGLKVLGGRRAVNVVKVTFRRCNTRSPEEGYCLLVVCGAAFPGLVNQSGDQGGRTLSHHVTFGFEQGVHL